MCQILNKFSFPEIAQYFEILGIITDAGEKHQQTLKLLDKETRAVAQQANSPTVVLASHMGTVAGPNPDPC